MADETKGKKIVLRSTFGTDEEFAKTPQAFQQICAIDPMVRSVWEEAVRPAYRQDPNFCREQLWDSLPQASGKFGLKRMLSNRRQEWMADHNRFGTLLNEETWMWCCSTIMQAMPMCAHAPGEYHREVKGDGRVAEWVDNTCTSRYPLEVSQKVLDGKATSMDRFEGRRGFVSLIDALNGEPTKFIAVHQIPDQKEPVFIVDSPAMNQFVRQAFNFAERLAAGKISRWYYNNATVLVDEETRANILELQLTRESMTGALAWKPVVLTFKDDQLLDVLQRCCVSVAYIDLTSSDSKVQTLEQFREAYLPITMASDVGLLDMPQEVLDGGLGDICRKYMDGLPVAYAWPSLLLAASVFIKVQCQLRTNLYVNIVGEIGSGKSSAMELAAKLLGLTNAEWKQMQFGSFEGLSQDDSLSQANGGSRLVYVDELVHLLTKAGIQSSTLANNLDTLFYNDKWQFVIAHGKKIEWNCRLSLGGGMPEDAFGDLFGANTIGGFYDRFLFSIAPTDYAGYNWRPLDTIQSVRTVPHQQITKKDYEDAPFDAIVKLDTTPPPTIESPVKQLAIDKGVWQESDRWKRELKIDHRCVEIALRVAAICAAFDGRSTLYAEDLGPALALAQYQQRVRAILSPNPGKDDVAILQAKITRYLLTHGAQGQAVNRRAMYNAIRAYDYDLQKVERAINNLVVNGDVEVIKQGKSVFLRLTGRNQQANG